MAVINPHFLKEILEVHERQQSLQYPFFDPACVAYEALRAVQVEGSEIQAVLQRYGVTEYAYRKSLAAFHQWGVAGLIGLGAKGLVKDLPLEVERMIVVLKHARPSFPATKMVILLKGFGHTVSLVTMRHLYASYGWSYSSRGYPDLDFGALNLKVIRLAQLQSQSIVRASFFHPEDHVQALLEVFRTLGTRGITKRYQGSRVSFHQDKQHFLSLGLLGLVKKARAPFRNSKLGFVEEGRLILSKIQHPKKKDAEYLRMLKSKHIEVVPTCLTNIFSRWKVDTFQSQFVGNLTRFLELDMQEEHGQMDSVQSPQSSAQFPTATSSRVDTGFIRFVNTLTHPIPLANPGVFLFVPYLNRLKIFDKAGSLMNVDPATGYSWFSLLLLNLGRILAGISTNSKACRTHELCLPLMAGLVSMPSPASLLNGLAAIDEHALLQLRQYLTCAAHQHKLIEVKRIAFDFKMQEFSGEDIELKQIGKGPSPKRKICFPGFRPHIAWDVDTSAPITLEFRNGKARASTTIKQFVQELLHTSLGQQNVEHVYLDSEYTAEHVWKFIVAPQEGLGADLTMCVKQNKRVKKYITAFLDTRPTWLFFDETHTYSQQTFPIPIQGIGKPLQCVLKRKETTGQLRCFGSTLPALTSLGILKEYSARWRIENGIKDLVLNYYLENIPGTDPHRINIHYFVVNLARILYEMLCRDYPESRNPDGSQKTIDVLRPEFLTGTNATLYREKDVLVITWQDQYSHKQHQALTTLFDTLNDEYTQALPFLGGMKLRFEIVPSRTEDMINRVKRDFVEFC